jgi:hypothetical protein
MVTLDLKSGGRDDWSAEQSGGIAELTSSRLRSDLSGPINRSLNRVAGYRQLGVRVTVAQKDPD